jgi:Domain of unknown function (DUF222)
VATPAPASTAEAMDMVLTGLSYLAATDPTALAAQAQAECLQTLEQADAMSTAVRAWFLAAFTAGQGHSADADYSPISWLIHRTRTTKGAARGHMGQLPVETTFQGAGVISGDLTPECAAVVTTVLEALSAPMGAEDTRTKDQRYHDALEDAMRSLCFCIVI